MNSGLFSLRFAILPTLVMVVAHTVFSLVGFGLDRIIEGNSVFVCQNTGLESDLSETKARLLWATSALLYLSVLLGVCYYALRSLVTNTSGKNRILYLLLGGVGVLVSLGHVIYSGYVENNFSKIFFFTYSILSVCSHYSHDQVRVIEVLVGFINLLSAIVPVTVIFATCSIFIDQGSTEETSVNQLKVKMDALKMCINGGSVILVAGIIHMHTWLRWPASLISEGIFGPLNADLAENVVLYWGTAFSLLIAALYIPAAASISRTTEKLLHTLPELHEIDSPNEWLRSHGLSFTPLAQIPQIVAMFAPILAGPIGSSLTTVTGSISM